MENFRNHYIKPRYILIYFLYYSSIVTVQIWLEIRCLRFCKLLLFTLLGLILLSLQRTLSTIFDYTEKPFKALNLIPPNPSKTLTMYKHCYNDNITDHTCREKRLVQYPCLIKVRQLQQMAPLSVLAGIFEHGALH